MNPGLLLPGLILASLGVVCERAGAGQCDPWGRGLGVFTVGLGVLVVVGGVIA